MRTLKNALLYTQHTRHFCIDLSVRLSSPSLIPSSCIDPTGTQIYTTTSVAEHDDVAGEFGEPRWPPWHLPHAYMRTCAHAHIGTETGTHRMF